jgi:hypothetical protein
VSNPDVTVRDLLGCTLTSCTRGHSDNDGDPSDEIVFVLDSGERFRMYHRQDCCEDVYLDDVAGDLQDLVGSPITLAEEAYRTTNPEGVPTPKYQEDHESFTWTFYRFATVKGYVTLRWYGGSNGYYSESVDFVRV